MRNLQHTATTGRYTLPISIFLTLICWVVVYFNTAEITFQEVISYPFTHYIKDILPNWARQALSLVCCFIIGFLLISINNYYAIIRRRASVQTSIFLLFVSACPALHFFSVTDIAIILVLFSIYNLFKCYQQHQPTGYVFNAFVFLGLSSLLYPPLLWLIPIFILGVGIINKLDLRNLVAALLGSSISYWFLWGMLIIPETLISSINHSVICG